MKNLSLLLIAISGLLIAPRASAIEPLTAIQLQEACSDAGSNADSSESRLCIYYVKGFLDGAVATDARVAENVASEIDEQESFAERAIRTRVINRLKEFGPSVYANFCVGQPDPIVDVVRHVIEELDRYKDLEGVQAQTVVYDSLRRHYPCSAQ
jgi:hypothetical protein